MKDILKIIGIAMLCLSNQSVALEKKTAPTAVKQSSKKSSKVPTKPKPKVAQKRSVTPVKKSASLKTKKPIQQASAKKTAQAVKASASVSKPAQSKKAKPMIADPNHLMPGETIVAFLERHGLSKAVAESIWKLPKAKQQWLSDIRPSHNIVCYGQGVSFKSCHIMLSDKSELSLIRLGDQIEIEQQAINANKSINYGEFTVENSMFLDGKRKGYDTQLLNEVYGAVRALLQDQKLVRKGDKVEFIYEKKQLGHGVVVLGRVVDVVYHGVKKSFHLSWFGGKEKGFYDESGRLAALSFIRFPVNFSHISSKFSKGRKHPVYGIVKPHHGVDLAAKMQTPIKATAEGKIIYADVKGGYGNTIMIQHNAEYKTLYAHMHHFAKASKVGHYVKAGEVIGYVGSTGVSTGPHVHYEIRKNNTPIDPVNSVLPSLAKLDAKSMKLHQQAQAKWDMLRLSLTDSA